MENPVVEVDVMADPPGNRRVLWISFLAFSLGFAVWGMFSALAPFLIKWYDFSTTQVLVLASMEPFFAAAVSIPLGILTDKFGGRTVFTLLLLSLTIILFSGSSPTATTPFCFWGRCSDLEARASWSATLMYRPGTPNRSRVQPLASLLWAISELPSA